MSPRKRLSGLSWLILILAAAALLALAYGLWKTSERRAAEASAPEPVQSTAPERTEPTVGSVESEKRPVAGQATPAPQSENPYGVDTPAHEILAGMRDAWECYASSSCRLGADNDPRAEYFEADRRIAVGMRTLTARYRAGQIGQAELSAAALEVLEYDGGRARAAAIGALGQLPPTPEHLNALFRALDQHHDEKLFEIALDEFERYAEAGYGAEVDAFLQSNLLTGAAFPARTIARELGRFLTPANEAAYRQVAEQLPPGSRRAELARQALDAYGQPRSGGS